MGGDRLAVAVSERLSAAAATVCSRRRCRARGALQLVCDDQEMPPIDQDNLIGRAQAKRFAGLFSIAWEGAGGHFHCWRPGPGEQPDVWPVVYLGSEG